MQTQCNPCVDIASILQARRFGGPGEKVKAFLPALGLTVVEVADRLGHPRTYVSKAIHHRSGSDAVRRRIVNLINQFTSSPVEYTDIWPADWSKAE